MKTQMIKLLLILLLFLLSITGVVRGQAIAIKKWKGRYPQMNNNYPASFIAFKGWLPPVPHLFVKTPTTHYYWKVKSIPVTDSEEITGKIKTGLLRLAAKMMERSQFKGRYQEMGLIKLMTDLQKEIDQKIFDSRTEHLGDIYSLSEGFIILYQKLEQLDQLEKGAQLKKILKTEANDLLEQFLMVNLLESEQGEKVKLFAILRASLIRLNGELDYSYEKMKYFTSFPDHYKFSCAFLTQ